MPLFSVVVPMYNVEKYAKQCIESILTQTYKDFEVILVNDGAKDSTPQIINEYVRKDIRVKVINKENGGLVSARKTGANSATGEYIVPVDGDDWIHPEYLKKFADIIQSNPGLDIVCSNSFYANNEGKIEIHNSYDVVGMLNKSDLAERFYLDFLSFPQSQWAKVYKRELYIKFQNQIDECITIGEDSVLVLPMLYEITSLFVLPECLYYYRYNPASMTKNRKKEWSTEGLLARLKLFEESLELDAYNLEIQFTAYVAHAVINHNPLQTLSSDWKQLPSMAKIWSAS